MYAGDLENYKRRMYNYTFVDHHREDAIENSMTMHMYGTLALMCPRCYHIEKYNVIANGKIAISPINSTNVQVSPFIRISHYNDGPCPECGNDNYDLIEIDPNIADTISILNRKGFHTAFCCEGHGDYGTMGYIYFVRKYIMEKYIGTLPPTWYVDLDDIRREHFIIRSESSNYVEAMLDIYEWAKSLPTLIQNPGRRIRVDENCFGDDVLQY